MDCVAVVQEPPAVHWETWSEGWVSAVSVPACWPRTTAARVNDKRAAARNIMSCCRAGEDG